MKVYSSAEVGAAIRDKRKSQGYTQEQLAEYCGCGPRFISDLENGKETAQLGKTLMVLMMLGLDVRIESRK